MYKIAIPKPCFESWEQMTPDGNGRYCSSCAKTVIDFSVMSDEEVQQYFTSHYSNKICGHFKSVQLQRIVIELPQNIFRIQLPFWKKFLVILLLSYGGSFMGIDIGYANKATFIQGSPAAEYLRHKKIKKNKQHNYKRKKRTWKLDPRDLSFKDCFKNAHTTYGMTVRVEKPSPPFSDYASRGLSINNTNDSTVTVVQKTGNNNREKEPGPIPIPFSGELVLPAAINKRRSFFSKKKD